MARQVIKEDVPDVVHFKDILRDKVYVYTGTAGGVWVLSRLGRYVCNKEDDLGRTKYHYGFVRVDKTDEVPVFCAQWDYDTVEKALNSGRTVLEFDNFGDFMRWRLKSETGGK